MSLLRWALIQSARCPDEKRKCRYTDIMSMHSKDHVKAQEDGHLQAKDTSEEIKPANTLILAFQPPQVWQNKFHLFKPPSLKHRHTSFYCTLQTVHFLHTEGVCGNCMLASLWAPFFPQHLLTSDIYYVTFWLIFRYLKLFH